jgi:gentisate 1,2-dioxygenase
MKAQPNPAPDKFHERIHANHIYGLWELASQMTAHPEPKAIPYMWTWSLLEPIIKASGEMVPVGDERRAHPTLRSISMATRISAPRG